MIDKIKDKIEELEKEYDYWLELYDRDGLEYQNNTLCSIRAKLSVLRELIEGCDKE